MFAHLAASQTLTVESSCPDTNDGYLGEEAMEATSFDPCISVKSPVSRRHIMIPCDNVDEANRPSARKHIASRRQPWRFRIWTQLPVSTSQVLAVPSREADARRLESGEKQTENTESKWPSRVWIHLLQLLSVAAFVPNQGGTTSLNMSRILLSAGANTSKDEYSCKGATSKA